MNRRARTPLLSVFLLVLTAFAASNIPSAQVVMQPTPSPTVTAENEQWYLKGEPIAYAGNLYYPSGAQIFFSPNEMVRSGFYQGIPLYARTTIEPYSIVYVPLAGGRMQPYERPRSGEIAGTAGSTPTTLPTPAMTVPPAGAASQAAGPPSETVRVVPVFVPSRPEVEGTSGTPSEAPAAVSTGGRTSTTVRPTHSQIGGRPQGTNTIFIEFDGVRWYPAGPAEVIDAARLIRVGDYFGFAVWAADDSRAVIYVPVTRGGTLAVPYTRTPKR